MQLLLLSTRSVTHMWITIIMITVSFVSSCHPMFTNKFSVAYLDISGHAPEQFSHHEVPESGTTILDMESMKPVPSSLTMAENIIFASVSEAKICTCPPGTCQKNGCCCSTCPGSMTICTKDEPGDMNQYISNESICSPMVNTFTQYSHLSAVVN